MIIQLNKNQQLLGGIQMKTNNQIALDTFASPITRKKKLKHEWEQFITGNSPSSIISPLMYESWMRCKDNGVNPYENRASINLNEEQIRDFLSSDSLFRILKPILSRLKDHFLDSRHLITYCNSSGDITYLDGDLALRLKAEDINFVIGSSWAENTSGTNAIGTALATGSPIQVFAGEHFCHELHQWTCSAAPILDPATREILGVIDMTGLWTENHPQLLSAVNSAAHDAAAILRNQLELERYKLIEYYQAQAITRRSNSYLIALDRGWNVIKASPILYEEGLINANHYLVTSPSLSLTLTSRVNWELEHQKGIWRFELHPYIYGGMSIGAIVYVFPPTIFNSYDSTFGIDNIFPHVKKETAPLLSRTNNLELSQDLALREQDPVNPVIRDTEFYQALFEHNPDGIYSCDLQENLLTANPAFERIVGYSVEELQRLPLSTLILPEYAENRLKHLKKTKTGIMQEYEVSFKHKNGYLIDAKVKSFPLFINNEIAGIYEIIKDNTENKQIEKDLQFTKQQLELFLKNTIDSIIIFDLQGKIMKVNKAFEEIFGWTEDEVLGRKLPIVPNFLLKEFTEILPIILKNKQVMSFETICKRKDENLIDISSFYSPIINDKGKVTAIVAILRNISERKQMEKALKESEKRLRTLINAMPDTVLFKDGEGRWLVANQYVRSCFQLENVSYQGKTNSELASYNEFYRDTLTFCDKTDEEAWEKRQIFRTEEVISHPNGKSTIFDVIKVPIFHSDGSRNGLVIIGRDITEKKLTEELLRKSEKLAVVGQLSAGIAHEIRNPLTSLKGFLSLLDSTTDKKNSWYLDVMVSEVNRIESITNQFMAVAKPQAITIQSHALQDLIEEVSMIVSPEALMNNVQIIVESEADIPMITCDVNQLKQVFINILKNAIESMPNGGEINVKTMKLENNQLLIRFSDQGIGIPNERIPYLGEPFYSLKEKGTGLGLMMCYKIIKEHQGQIMIDSEIDKGTTVEVILPVKN